jgi:hypothetical protein
VCAGRSCRQGPCKRPNSGISARPSVAIRSNTPAGRTRDDPPRIDESWNREEPDLKSKNDKDVPLAFLPHEFDIAYKLAEEGHGVVARGAKTGRDYFAPGAGGSFDAWVDGVRTEFKEQTTSKPGSIAQEIRSAQTQGADAVIIHLPEGNERLAESAIRSAKKTAFTSKQPLNLTSIRIYGDGFDITENLRQRH